MKTLSWVATAALLAALTGPAQSAAPLNVPLPANSLEQNGKQQPVGEHILKAIPLAPLPEKGIHKHAAAGLKRLYSGTPVDVLKYHNDNYPTGWNKSETDLTPASVASPSFGKLSTINVDGLVLAEPLMVSGFKMPDGSTHNILLVVTMHDTVYAFDAQSYAVLWQVSLGTSQSTSDVGCMDIEPEYGIAATPVIQRSAQNSAVIYLVAATEPARYSFHTQIHALDLGTGKDLVTPVEIAPTATLSNGQKIAFDPQNQWTRTGLVYSNGNIYMGVGSHCDNNANNISGWVLSFSASNLSPTGAFNTIETNASYKLSSMWMSGYSPAVDPNGNIFGSTGNGAVNLGGTAQNFGESILSLPPSLKTLNGYFTPSNYQSLNNADGDLGSGGVMLIPTRSGQLAPPMAVAMGKEYTSTPADMTSLFLLNATKLGGLQSSTNPALQQLNLNGSGCWCGPAYFAGSSIGVVFYQIGGDVLRAYAVSTAAQPALVPAVTGTSSAGFGGSFPVGSGADTSTAMVWLVRRGSPTIQFEAYNGNTLGTPLFQANAGTWSHDSRSFVTPLVANGRVYVGAYKTVTV